MRDLIYLITFVTCPGNGFFTNFANRRRCQIRTAHPARISIEHIKKYKYYPIRIVNIDLIDPIELY